MPGRALLVILDGIGDRSCQALGWRTPLQAASTPVLDQLAREGMCGLHYPLYPGACTGSDLAHWSLFGYEEEEFPGRALMHARALDLEPPPGRVMLMGNIVPVRESGGALHVDYGFKYAGRQCEAWTDALQGIRCEGILFNLHHLGNEEVLVVLEGDSSPDVTDSDPFFPHLPIMEVVVREEAADPSAAGKTAAALNGFLREAKARLGRLGEEAAFVTKWPSVHREVEPFEERWGLRAALLASGSLYAGLALTLGMDGLNVRGESPGMDLRAKLKDAWQLLVDGYELVVVHTKEPDEAAHTGDPYRKAHILEELDRALAEVPELIDDSYTLKVITGDHSTATEAGPRLIHSGEPVPVLFNGRTVRRDGVEGFDEVSCAAGALGTFSGAFLLPLILNFLNRASFLSSRPSARRLPYLPMQAGPLFPL